MVSNISEEEKNIEKEKNVEKEAYYSVKNEQLGGVIKIATDVIALIAGIAASETDGVAAMAGKSQMFNKNGVKARGIRIEVRGDTVSIDISMVISYGYSIKETARKVQERVKASVEDMTGLAAKEINVHIVGIQMPNGKVSMKDE